MDADAAHFMNVARCFERGQGFSNPSAWPAWMRPASLPMPETFKEPAYSWAIAKLSPLTKSPFRAGQMLSFLAGLLTPLLTWMLVRRLHPERGVAFLAGLLAAASPLLIARSSLVMVESLFAAVFTLLWVVLLSGREGGGARGAVLDLSAGVIAGVAFMLRAQTLVAVPAIAILLLRGGLADALRRSAVIAVAAIVTASPFLLRNLRLFGSPFHSDVGAFGLMPYMDVITMSGSLERPPAPLGYALHHLPQVIAHSVSSAVRFAVRTLPADVLGNPAWMVPLAIGVLLTLARWRDWLWVYVQLAITMAFIFAVNWDDRYFATSVPLWCALAAPGAWWIAERLWTQRLWGPLGGREVLVAALATLLLLQAVAARRTTREWTAPESLAARSEAAFLREHLKPDEAVMALTTSYYAYWADRPAVYVIFADPPRFEAEAKRLQVRYAAFPTSRLAELAAHFPDGRLPDALVADHADPAHDVTIFQVR